MPSHEGLYPLVVHLLLTRPVGAIEAGAYRVTSQRPKVVELSRVAGRSRNLPWRVLERGCNAGGSGFVVLSGSFARGVPIDGSRTLMHTLIEAGRAAQNLELSAIDSGMATQEVTALDPDAVRRWLRLSPELTPLLAIGFGSRSTGTNRPSTPNDPIGGSVEIMDGKVGTFHMPFPIAAAFVGDSVGIGVGSTRALAKRKARAEALERFALNGVRNRANVAARFEQVAASAVHPSRVLAYAPGQLRSVVRVKPFDPESTYDWHEVRDFLTDEPRLVLADFVGSSGAARGAPYAFATSSGAAAHGKRSTAVLNGLLELVERDAFTIAWLNRLGRTRFAKESLPLEVRSRLARIERHGYEVHVVDLTLDMAPVVLIVTIRRSPSLLTCTAGAGFDLSIALGRALSEAEVTTYFQLRNQWCGPLVAPNETRTNVDHASLYRAPYNIRQASFLFRGPEADFDRIESRRSLASPAALFRRLEASGIQVLVADLRAGDARLLASDMHVVKVIAPGLVPLTFGYGLEPLGMTRVRAVPRECGLRRVEASLGDLNRFPHPFS